MIDIDLMMELVNRRINLCKNSPSCPKCKENFQIQLVNWINPGPAKWKCRTCKHKFEYENN